MSPVVLTVSRFKAGMSHNVISDEAELTGTIRTFDRDVWTSMRARMERIIKGVCDGMGAAYEFTYSKGYPSYSE